MRTKMKGWTSWLAAIASGVAFAALPEGAVDARESVLVWLQSAEANEHYQAGREALDREDWDASLEAFEEAAEDEALEDAALYWQAYALSKSGDASEALERIEELESEYPQSQWRDDAQALAVEIQGAAGRRQVAASSDQDDLKLMALNGLMHADEEEALPILEEFLAGNHAPKLKERALFILAQSDSDRAHESIARIARRESDAELQRKAIRYLGVHSSSRNVALLSELYESLSSVDARRAVLQSFMVAGERERLLQVAKTEAVDELRQRAVRHLGALGAEIELGEMYQSESSLDVKKTILQALMVSGATEPLLAVAQNREEPEELRESAVRLLGVSGANDQLWTLYQSETSDEIKKRILRALFIAGETERLSSVARDSTESEELRKAAIHNLGISGERSRSLLLSMYASEPSHELKEGVLHALFLQEADTELIEIARAETNAELKKKAVHWLSLMGTEAAKNFLVEILRQ